jgi:hypothetical protein
LLIVLAGETGGNRPPRRIRRSRSILLAISENHEKDPPGVLPLSVLTPYLASLYGSIHNEPFLRDITTETVIEALESIQNLDIGIGAKIPSDPPSTRDRTRFGEPFSTRVCTTRFWRWINPTALLHVTLPKTPDFGLARAL